jgi:hypothetical protein
MSVREMSEHGLAFNATTIRSVMTAGEKSEHIDQAPWGLMANLTRKPIERWLSVCE